MPLLRVRLEPEHPQGRSPPSLYEGSNIENHPHYPRSDQWIESPPTCPQPS